MPYDPIQGQGHGGPKVTKMADFKVYLLCRCTVVSVPLSVECEAKYVSASGTLHALFIKPLCSDM